MKAREKLVTRTFVPHPDLHDAVEHLWACEKCRQAFRLVNG